MVDRLRVERSIPKEAGLQPAAVASAAHDPRRDELMNGVPQGSRTPGFLLDREALWPLS